MPMLMLIRRSTIRDADVRDGGPHPLRNVSGTVQTRRGEQDEKLLAPVSAGEVTRSNRVGDRRTDGGQHVVTPAVAESVVDLLEVVQVTHQSGERRHRTRRLSHHAFENVMERAAVRQSRESVGRCSPLRDCEVAQVPENGCGLQDGLSDGSGLIAPQRGAVIGQD